MERNEEYRERFPHVRIVQKDGDHSFTVQRDRILKEPTVTSTYAGGPISGGRWDRIICDDLVNLIRNSKTRQARKYLREWFYRDVVNSLARGGRLTMLGTPQHHEDLHTAVEEDKRFRVAKYPAVDEEDTGYGNLGYRAKNEARGVTGPDADVLWPRMHDHASHMEKKENDSDSYLSQQQLQNVPPGSLVYRRPLVEAALQRGKKVRPDKSAHQVLALDPGYSKRASLLAIQERAGDRVELWGEYSFTQIDDDGIAKVVVEHCREWGVTTIYMDAEDPGLAATISRELENAGLEVEIVRVPFGKYKRLAIGATRWLLGSCGDRLAWRAETTTVYRPGKVRSEKSLYRKEILDYALDPNKPDEPIKEDDHGPDAWHCYAVRWIEAWLEATERKETSEQSPDRALKV